MTPRGKAPIKGKGKLKPKTPITHYLVIAAAVLGLVTILLALFVLPRYLRHTVQDVPGHKNLQALAVFYGRYLGQHRGKPPSNIEEFKAWLRTQEAGQFESLGVAPGNPDALFVSPRDNQPYGFVLSASAMSPGPDGKGSVVIYEKTGVGGKRLVAYTTSQIAEVDEATFKRLVPGM